MVVKVVGDAVDVRLEVNPPRGDYVFGSHATNRRLRVPIGTIASQSNMAPSTEVEDESRTETPSIGGLGGNPMNGSPRK
jgi:hypothetical protein